eukprot:6230332-Amphidinium_carterae.1
MGDYARRSMERKNSGTVISDVSFAGHLLRRSGLPSHDQKSVLAACGAKWSAPDIEAALKLLYHDAHMQCKYKRNFSQPGIRIQIRTDGSLRKGRRAASSKKRNRRRLKWRRM